MRMSCSSLAFSSAGSIEARVLDGQRRLGGERLERAARRRREQRAALARVEIQHADAARRDRPDGGGVLDVAHDVERHAQDVADAERHRAHVDVGQLAVEEVGDQPRVAGLEDLFGNLAAGLEGAALERLLAAAAAHLELERAVVAGEHDEAALGAADVDGRVEHQREHVVEHAAGAERPQAFEQARDVAQVADRAGRRSRDHRDVERRRRRPGGYAEPTWNTSSAPPVRPSRIDVAGLEQPLGGHRVAVDEGAEARVLVAQQVARALHHDLGVIARHLAAAELQVVGVAAADGERHRRHVDRAPAGAVDDVEARGHCHGITGAAPRGASRAARRATAITP